MACCGGGGDKIAHGVRGRARLGHLRLPAAAHGPAAAWLEPAYGRSRPELLTDGETLVEVDGGAGGLGKMFWDRKKARDKGEEEGAVPALFANGVMVGGSDADRAKQKKANGGW